MSKEASKAVLLFSKSIIKNRRGIPMKTKEELNKIKEEVEAVNEKLNELTPEELEKVNGGVTGSLKPFSEERGFGYIED